MVLLTPAPSVLGACSLTAAVQLVCAVHLCVCIGILASVSSDRPIMAAGVEISGGYQCITGAWFLLGVPLIVHGGFGAVYYVESNLTIYMAYLAGTLVWAVAWIVIFVEYGNTCSTLQPGPDALAQASFVCGVSNGMVVFWMLALVGLIVAALYLVWSMREWAKRRLEAELIRYQEPWQMVQSLADDVAAEHALEFKALSQAHVLAPRGQGWGLGGPSGFATPLHPMSPGYGIQMPGSWQPPVPQTLMVH